MHRVESAETTVEEIQPRGPWRTVAKLIGLALLLVYFVFGATILFLRYWALPRVGEYRADIEQYASRALGQRIAIGAIEAGWQGLRPELFLGSVTIHDHDGRAALTLPKVEATFGWTSILLATPRFYSLAFDRPRLEIRRDASGKLFVAGMEPHAGQAGSPGLTRWLLAQREIAIRDAGVTWIDEQRGAPALSLSQVNLVLRDGYTHRFSIRAKAPAALASALEVRGELRGRDFTELRTWTGSLFAQLDYTDLAAWQQWIDYPFALQSGRGGVRLWLEFSEKSLIEATADVALSQVVTRLDKDLPMFEIESLRGRLGASRRQEKGIEVFGSKVTLVTSAGVTLPPADFRVRWQPAEPGIPQSGEIEIDALQLEPLARLAEFLPLPRAARERLAATEPSGSLTKLRARWTDAGERPARYEARGSFGGLAARANAGIPGFAGLTGNFEASDKGGVIALASGPVAVELPRALPESPVRLDSLSGRINWTIAPDRLEVGIDSLVVANRDFAGTLSGSYATRPDGPGVLDVEGALSRADGRAAFRYIPFLPPPVTEYLRLSIREGSSNDIRLRFKGDLAKFPFGDPASGTFRIVAKVSDAEFRFAEGWPAATGVSGDLVFDGRSMRVTASKAGILNLRASSLSVFVPDLYGGDERVQVNIQAEDQTRDFLDFIARTPVTKALDGMTEGMRANGVGRLALKCDIPIRRPERFTVAGDYRMINNEVRIDADAPPFTQVNGAFEFTESGMAARTLTSRFLGGPATISVSTRDRAIEVDAQGSASVAQIPVAWGESLMRRVSGTAAWRGTLKIAPNKGASLVVHSPLTGVSSDLPPPFGKSAAETMALRLERVIEAGASRGDRFRVSLGPAVNAQFERRWDGSKYVLRRGVIGLNEAAIFPEREGISVTGTLPYVDFDRWRELVGGGGEPVTSFSSSLKLQAGVLDFAGRRLNEVDLRAGTSGEVWIVNVAAKELSGEIAWRPDGGGRIVARLKHFSLPGPAPGKTSETASREMPALDIIADRLILNNNDLGRLELIAVNKALDWQIEKLVLTGPESSLNAEGRWQNWALQPSFSLNNIRLDVKDVGRFLDRVGFPGTVQGGAATLKGNLSWSGSPQSIDYASLSGNLDLEVARGQFLKADPGAAKLIGILSMQSWVTLDFRELFNRGFAFDTVSCNAIIADGVLRTDNFRMKGPSAQVVMRGETDLARETQDLNARVEPEVGNSLSVILGVVINPVWGLGSLLLQQILKNPLATAFAFEYRVTGTWTEPEAKRLKLDVQTSEATQGPPQ